MPSPGKATTRSCFERTSPGNGRSFPGDTGGLLANVNSWRGQVGLADIAQSDLQTQVTPVDVAGGKAMLVDVPGLNPKTGQKAPLIGAIIPREGRTWFFKMMGEDKTVLSAKPAFLQFLASLQSHENS